MRAVPTLPAVHSRKRSPRALPVWLSTSRSRFRPVTATTGQRRLKFWGWGYEDQQPSHEEVREAAAGIRAHLGFTPEDAERPVSLEDLDLPEPRLRPPDGALGEICAADTYARASHAYGKAYRDVVRAFRGRIDHPPDLVAFPTSEDELTAVLDWCASAGAAAIPFGGGTSVVGGVEPRFDQPAVTIDLRAMDRLVEVDRESRAALIEAGATGPRLEEQ